jgi:hypothetical protein
MRPDSDALGIDTFKTHRVATDPEELGRILNW